MADAPQTPSGAHDANLLQLIARGSKRALTDLHARHGRRLFTYLLGQLGGDHALAEEVAQDVMLAVWQGAGRFRQDSSVLTWMLAIARYKALDVRRRNAGHDPLPESLPSEAAGPAAIIERQDRDESLADAIHKLPPDQQETLELIFYHGLTGTEAAEVLGVSPGTVKSRLYRAKSRLRGLLNQREVEL